VVAFITNLKETAMNVQLVKTPIGDDMILISKADYNALVESHDDNIDLIAIAELRRKIASGEEEMVPSEMVDRILNGENLTRVWREHRGLTIKALAAMIDVAPAYLSQIETGKRDGTVKTMQRIAKALGLKLDDLVSMD
jgi:DNA-binding XRE family transcriptional regulator/anti-sigma28 factor (negative regulator of flagellin synthesis)